MKEMREQAICVFARRNREDKMYEDLMIECIWYLGKSKVTSVIRKKGESDQ